MKFLTKLVFIIKKPRIVVVESGELADLIFHLLEGHLKIGKFEEESSGFFALLTKEILILSISNLDFDFLLKHSRQSILVISKSGDSGEITKLVKNLPASGLLVLNFDDVEVRNLKKEANSNVLAFGFYEGADIQATDIFQEDGTVNFKLNYGGGFVPIWLKLLSETKLEELEMREEIYPKLAAAAAGIVFGLNLVEISQGLK